MLTIKNRVMATAALFSIAITAPVSMIATSAEASVVVKQTIHNGTLIADRDDHHDGDREYSERHGRYINAGRHRRHYNKKGNYQYNNPYYQQQQRQVIYTQPQVIYQPQVITAPQPRGCVRTLYSTICN
jgi:hypothetical protein